MDYESNECTKFNIKIQLSIGTISKIKSFEMEIKMSSYLAMSTPRGIELNQDKLIAVNDLLEVVCGENKDTLVLFNLGAQSAGG